MPPRQRPSPLFSLFLAGAVLFLGPACDRDGATSGPSTTPATRAVARPTVASVSPAATDLLIGMGAADHLIAVSNWDAENPQTKGLPRVGDYRTLDRERLSELKPGVVVVQFRADKLPSGTTEFIQSLGARMVNIQIVTLDDVFTATRDLGDAIGAPDRAKAASDKLRAELDAVKQSVAGKPPVRVYIARAENGLDSVGGGNFVDDVLTIAGGTNVLTGGHNSFPTVDREQLIKLDPDVILHLLPAGSPQVVERTRRFWAELSELRAVKEGRVHVLDEYYVLQPSHRLGDTARLFAKALFPALRENGQGASLPLPGAPGEGWGRQARAGGATSQENRDAPGGDDDAAAALLPLPGTPGRGLGREARPPSAGTSRHDGAPRGATRATANRPSRPGGETSRRENEYWSLRIAERSTALPHVQRPAARHGAFAIERRVPEPLSPALSPAYREEGVKSLSHRQRPVARHGASAIPRRAVEPLSLAHREEGAGALSHGGRPAVRHAAPAISRRAAEPLSPTLSPAYREEGARVS